MQDGVDAPVDVDEVGDVVLDEPEALVARQVRDVVGVAGDEVVHADDRVALREEAVAKMRAEEPRPAGDEHPHAGFAFLKRSS